VAAAQPVVVHAGDVRLGGVDLRLPGPASPPAEELAAEELTAEAPGLLLGGRLDLAEITRLTLGLGTAIYGQARIKLPPGAVLALYTDGLVESRTRSFDQGILAMRSILAREHGHLEAICDALMTSLAGRCEDDITVILARIPAARAD
jgi:serine/threonine protein phosphatase PrpC